MPRLRGTERWSDEDISATVDFFLGCAENAAALRQELGPGREAVRIDPQHASPLENTDKESLMRERITDAATQFAASHSIELPDKSTEIDLLLADEVSSTVVFAELKWSRKPAWILGKSLYAEIGKT